MTESEWLVSVHVHNLKKFLKRPLSRRKCLLAVCGYGRHVQQHIPVAEVAGQLVRCEEGADSDPMLALPFEWFNGVKQAWLQHLRLNSPEYGICSMLLHALHFASERGAIGESMQKYFPLCVTQLACPNAHLDQNDLRRSDPEAVAVYEREKRVFAAMVLDTLGNPFRPSSFDPSWRTSDVVLLASGIYEQKAFDRLPILADALQDAGCESEDILNHCRSGGVHVRGCWVVDLVLGKE